METLIVDESELDSEVIDVEEQSSTNNEQQAIGSTSTINALSQGNDGGTAYRKAVQSGDLEGVMTHWQTMTAQQRLSSIEGKIDTVPPEEIAGELTSLEDNLHVQGHVGSAKESVKTIPASLQATEDEFTDEVLNTMVRHTLSNYSESETNYETVKSFLGVFIPERRSVLLNDVLDELGFDNSFLDTVAIDTDEIRKFRSLFDSLGNKDKARLIMSTNSAIEKHGDNPFINRDLTSALFSPTFEGERFNTAFNVLDATVVVDVAYLSKIGIVSGVQTANIINTGKRLKDPELTVKTIDMVKRNPEESSKAGVKVSDVVDAQDITMPLSAREILTGVPESQAGEIRYLMDLQDTRINDVLASTAREGVISSEERAAVIAQTEARFKEMDNVKSRSVRINQIDEATYEIKYKKVNYDKKGNEIGVEPVEKVAFFTTKDVQALVDVEDDFVNGFIALDANSRTKGQLREYFVSLIERVSPQQSRLTDAIDRAVKDAYKGLKAKNEARVNEALLEGAKWKNDKGENVGRVWSFDELTNVGVGVNRIKLSNKEAKAYIGHRNILDQMFELENARFTENLGARGISIVDLPSGDSLPAKVFETPEGAWNVFQEAGELAAITKTGTRGSPHISVQGQGLRKWSGKGGLIKMNKHHDIPDDLIEDAYDKGYVLAKNDNTQSLFKHGDTRTQWAFVKKETVQSPRNKRLLRRKTGYIPKQRTNSFFFVKTTKKGVLSGSDGFTVDSTVAWSDNLSDAQKYIDDNGLGETHKILKDHELSPEQMMYESNSTQGGMYSGARKTEEIEFIGKAGQGKFANSMEAIQGYVNHIGRQYPINLVRLGLEKRAIETANALGVNAKHLDDLISKGHMKNVSPKTQKILKEMHDQVAFIRNIPTEAEIALSNKLMSIGTALEGSLVGKIPAVNKIPKFFYNVAGKGTQPQDYVRGITFNTLLGMYNPAQVFVQASGMFASFAINPVHFTKGIPRAVGFITLDQIDNPFQLKATLNWMRNNGLDEYAEGYEMWARTGLKENVINSNADYTSVLMRQTPYDAGIIRKALANHTLFYKMGELANTRMAFSTAYEWYKKQNNLKRIDPTDDVALAAIFKRSEINRLNMSKANQSDLNKGLKAVPFQFQQVVSKYYEKVMPQVVGGTDELSSLEKMRLFGVVSGITGLVGVPFAESVYLSMLEMSDINPEDLDPETATAFKYGALGYTLSEGFNFNIDASTRMSLGIDAFKLITENAREGHDIFEFVGGPTHGVTKRAIKQVQFLNTAFDTYTDIDEDTTSFEDIQVGASMVFEAMADFATVSRNIKEYGAYLFTENPAFRKGGQYIVDFQTMNKQTAIGAIFGFQPTELTELYEISNTIKREQNSGSGVRPFFELEKKVMLRIINTNIMGADTDEEARIASLMVRAMLRKRPTKEGIEMFDAMNDLAIEKKLDQSNLYHKYIMEISDGINHGFGIINTTMSRQRELRE